MSAVGETVGNETLNRFANLFKAFRCSFPNSKNGDEGSGLRRVVSKSSTA